MQNQEKTVTNNDLAEMIIKLDLKIETEIESLAQMTKNQFDRQDEKFDNFREYCERKFEDIDRKFQSIDQRFDTVTDIITINKKEVDYKFKRLGIV